MRLQLTTLQIVRAFTDLVPEGIKVQGRYLIERDDVVIRIGTAEKHVELPVFGEDLTLSLDALTEKYKPNVIVAAAAVLA